MKNLTWQNPEQLFVAQVLINKVKSKCCGIKVYNTFYPHFNGGVGMSCYYRIAEFLGGKLEQIANAKMYDKYVFTFKNVRNNM